MFRKELADDSGMLFVFNDLDYHNFYMKNTTIPLDIAFLDNDFTVVDIQAMQPLNETSIIPKVKIRYALEVNRGFLKKIGIKIGDKILFNFGSKEENLSEAK